MIRTADSENGREVAGTRYGHIVVLAVVIWQLWGTQSPTLIVSAAPPRESYAQRVARTLEPDLVGSPADLARYITRFRDATFRDPRVIAFEVRAESRTDGGVELNGFVEFTEVRDLLVGCLHCLGFDPLVDHIEVLPSSNLGAKRFGILRTAQAASLGQPRPGAERVTTCLLGDTLFLLKEMPPGFLLCHAADGYVGYVKSEAIKRLNQRECHQYELAPHVRLTRDYTDAQQTTWPSGAVLTCVDWGDRRVIAEWPGGQQVSIPADYCRRPLSVPNPKVETVVDAARQLLETPYLWGGKTAGGIDCSGLVQLAFDAAGVHIARDANQQVTAGRLVATRWNRDGMKRGDTLYFMGRQGRITHTAIYLGEGKYLEAVRPRVRVSSFRRRDPEYSAERDKRFAFAKRLLE